MPKLTDQPTSHYSFQCKILIRTNYCCLVGYSWTSRTSRRERDSRITGTQGKTIQLIIQIRNQIIWLRQSFSILLFLCFYHLYRVNSDHHPLDKQISDRFQTIMQLKSVPTHRRSKSIPYACSLA